MLLQELDAAWRNIELVVCNAVEQELNEISVVMLEEVDLDVGHPMEQNRVEFRPNVLGSVIHCEFKLSHVVSLQELSGSLCCQDVSKPFQRLPPNL